MPRLLPVLPNKHQPVITNWHSLRKHPFLLALRRWGRFPRETSPEAKSEEKRMFSQATTGIAKTDILFQTFTHSAWLTFLAFQGQSRRKFEFYQKIEKQLSVSPYPRSLASELLQCSDFEFSRLLDREWEFIDSMTQLLFSILTNHYQASTNWLDGGQGYIFY